MTAVGAMRRLRSESGFALPIAIEILLIAVALMAVAVTAATSTNHLTNVDSGTKLALEASDAGLRTATYRLNMFLPDGSHCPTNPATPVNGSTNLCAQDGPESLGNGSTFTYWVSGALQPGDSCAGVPITVQSSSLNPQAVTQRCITATGTANAGTASPVTVRTQIRVADYSAQALFSVPGLIGLNSLSVANNATINGSGGTNGVETVNNGASLQASVLGPNGSLVTQTSASPGLLTRLTEAQGTLGLPLPSFGNTATVNNDSRIGAANSILLNCLPSPPPSSNVDGCGGVTWSDLAADPRDLKLSNGATLSLGGGVYNFCNFVAQNNDTINILAPTTLYIDSPNDPNSAGDTGTKCASGTGNFSLQNNITINNLVTDPANGNVIDPTALKIFVYGDPTKPGNNVVTWKNNTVSSATIVAPFSTVNLNNNGNFYGAAGGWNLNILNNFAFFWYGKEASLVTGQQDLYYRTAWRQCPAIGFNPGAPTAGC